ncbi:hypothetical protein [Aeromonas hydrophila]|uniref:hypothetical protein n=1 Tax=Aeromonas hydrophila TaxID=644 RepID=UPI00114D2A28|nr:hypothetical protein [Aeromonas hydrophila]
MKNTEDIDASRCIVNEPGFATWLPELDVKEPGFHTVLLVLDVPAPLDITPITWRHKLTRLCLRLLMPSLFSDFGAETAIGLFAVRQASDPNGKAAAAPSLDRQKAYFPSLELLLPAQKRRGLR